MLLFCQVGSNLLTAIVILSFQTKSGIHITNEAQSLKRLQSRCLTVQFMICFHKKNVFFSLFFMLLILELIHIQYNSHKVVTFFFFL